MKAASLGSFGRSWSATLRHCALAASALSWAKAVAMKAETTRRLLLPAWASALRMVWTRQRCQVAFISLATAALMPSWGDCQESCVPGRVSHHALTNLSSNMMANWVLASHHSRGGIFHVCATLRKTRYSNLIAASSVGKWPLVRTARRSLAFKDSMAFVV